MHRAIDALLLVILLTFGAALVVLTVFTSSAFSQALPEPRFDAGCKTNWSDRWLCPGDRAPHAGHLLEGWQVSNCADYARQSARIPQLQEQRDGCLARELVWSGEVERQQLRIGELEAGTSALKEELAERPTWWTVAGGVGGGTIGGFILAVLFALAL